MKVIFNQGQIPKITTGKSEQGHQKKPANDVKANKFAVVHPAHSCHKRSEGPDNRHKPGQNNGFTTMLNKKSLCFINMLLVNKRNFGIINNLFAKKVPDPIVNRISG